MATRQTRERARRTVQIEYEVLSKSAVRAIRSFARENRRSLNDVTRAVERTFPAWRRLSEAIGFVQRGISAVSGVVRTIDSLADSLVQQEQITRRVTDSLRSHGLQYRDVEARIQSFARSQVEVRGVLERETLDVFARFTRTASGLNLTIDQLIEGARIAQNVMAELGESPEAATRDLAEIMAGGVTPLEQWLRGQRELVKTLEDIPDPARRAAAAMEIINREFGDLAPAGQVESARARVAQFWEDVKEGAATGALAFVVGAQHIGESIADVAFESTQSLGEATRAFDDFAVRAGQRMREASQEVVSFSEIVERRLEAATFALESLGVDDVTLERVRARIEINRALRGTSTPFADAIAGGETGGLTREQLRDQARLGIAPAFGARRTAVGIAESQRARQAAGIAAGVGARAQAVAGGVAGQEAGAGLAAAIVGNAQEVSDNILTVEEAFASMAERSELAVVSSIDTMGQSLGRFIVEGKAGAQDLAEGFKTAVAGAFGQIGSAANQAAASFLTAGSFGPFGIFFGLGFAANLLAGLLSGGGGGAGAPSARPSGIQPADVVAQFSPQLRPGQDLAIFQSIGGSLPARNRAEARRNTLQLVAEGVDLRELVSG